MTDSETTYELTAYPYQVASPAEAVRLFFAERVLLADPSMEANTCTPQMCQRICDLAESVVADRLCEFYSRKPYGKNEEIEFTFKKEGEQSRVRTLTSPISFVKDLEYRFRGVGVYLLGESYYGLAASGKDNYVLRVSPSLVTFAGMIVWSKTE
jgi:hypothetical protein